MSKKKQRKDQENCINVCAFCAQPSDEKKCGKFFTSQFGFSVHQYCMFFSAALPQNGQDDEGFEGFLEQDVLKEVKRASRLRCYLCLKKGASAGCCDQNCKRGFHFTCGLVQKHLFQFYGQFRAYCFDHRLHQNSTSYPSKEAACPICLESVPCCASPEILTTPCCNDVWLHRSCVQEQATVSGYFFRCAVCNNKEKFVQEMKRMGVYVPDRDAAWEEGNNFAELLEKYSRCDNTHCRCPMGRQYSADSGDWELVLCSSCGQYGTHVGCKNWSTNPPSMLCPTCRPVHEPAVPPAEPLASHQVRQESVEKSPVIRKGRGRSRGKRTHTESSDTDSDDISAVLNGLKRQTEDDFLNSDTNFFVQRAIAAGNAVMEHSGPKKSRTSQSVSATSKNSCNRKRKAEDACQSVSDTSRSTSNVPRKQSDLFWNAPEDSEDEIMITKYVPGQKCQMCTKCNRRKPMKTSTSSPAKIPRKFSPTGSTSTVGQNTGSTCTITKADIKVKDAGNEFASFETSRGKCDEEAAGVKVADYEVLELAAEHTDKSSVLLISSEDTPRDCKDTFQENHTNLTKNERDWQQDPQINPASKVENSNSFWTKILGEKFLSFLNPHSSLDEENNNRRTEVRETSEITRQPSDALGSSSENSRQMSESNAEMAKKVSSVSSRKSGSPRKRTTAVDRSSGATVHNSNEKEKVDVTLCLKSDGPESAGGKGTGERSPSSETTKERSLGRSSNNTEPNSKPAQPDSNTEKFCSRSGGGNSNSKKVQFLTKKAVLEAVIEHTVELKNSGKELKQRCVSSC